MKHLLKTTLAIIALTCGAATAATYAIQDIDGEFVYGQFGTIAEMQADFDANLLVGQKLVDICAQSNPLDPTDPDCFSYYEGLSLTKAGEFRSFDEYVDYIEVEVERFGIYVAEWKSKGLTVNSQFFSGVRGSQESLLGIAFPQGDAQGPRGFSLSIDGDQFFESINISNGGSYEQDDYIQISGGGVTKTLASGFDGIYNFGSDFVGVQSIDISINLIDQGRSDAYGLSVSNLITGNVSAVPIPSGLPMLIGALGLLAVTRRPV